MEHRSYEPSVVEYGATTTLSRQHFRQKYRSYHRHLKSYFSFGHCALEVSFPGSQTLLIL